MLSWQSIVLVRQQAEAESDARLLARAGVVCGAPEPSTQYLDAVDPRAATAQVESALDTRASTRSVTVTLLPQSVIPDLDLSRATSWRPLATVTMHQEPC